jgi:hypothetical protein
MKRIVTFRASLLSALRKPYCWLCMASVLLLMLSTSVDLIKAQSKDRDNPTQLTSNVISGTIRPDNKGDNYHYTFVAGPGDVTIRLTVESGGRVNQVAFDLFDEDANSLAHNFVTAGDRARSEQIVAHVQVTRRQRVLLRIILSRFYYGPGKYRLSIDGAVDFGNHTSGAIGSVDDLDSIYAEGEKHIRECLQSLPNLPELGWKTLRVKMKDGSIKRIDLSQIEEITIER